MSPLLVLRAPNASFRSAERLAKKLGLSRSKLYAFALADFLAKHRGRDVTKQLDQLYASEASALDPDTVELQLWSLPREEW